MATNGNGVLRELREKLGVTQQEMAHDTGLSSGFICQVETGAEQLGHKAGLAIVDVYRRDMRRMGITLEDLLRGARGRAA